MQSRSSPLASTHLQFIESPVSRIRGRNSRYARCHSAWIRRLSRLHRTTDYATVLLPLPGISNDLEVVRLL